MNRILFTSLCCAIAATAHAAPIGVSGSMTYTQDFNVLASATDGTTSTSTWADDTTLPGWTLWKAGPTSAGAVGAAYTYRVSSGIPGLGNTLVDTGHFYSIGAPGAADRALGSVPITGAGEHSCIVMFENTGLSAVRLGQIAYNVETRRTNQTGGNIETLALWWRVDTSPAALLTMTTATATVTDWPVDKSTSPSGQFITGWNRLSAADDTYFNPAANTQVDLSRSIAVIPADLFIEPGEFLALRWGNINDGGADALTGIDDLSVEFISTTGLSGAAENVVRNAAGTPRAPGDDTVSFNLNITGPGAGWIITSPPALAGTTGTYGVPRAIPAQPIASFTGASHTLRIEFADQAAPGTPAALNVIAPWCEITAGPATGFTYLDKGTPDPADDEVTYNLHADGTWTGAQFSDGAASATYGTGLLVTAPAPGTFTSHLLTDAADPACTASITVFPPAMIGTVELTPAAAPLLSLPEPQAGAVQWSVNAAARTVTQTAVPAQGDHILRSATVSLATTGEAEITAVISAESGTSTSGFESADFIALDVIIDGGAPESALGTNDTDGDGRLTGTVELPANLANTTRTFPIKYLIPASASSVQVILTASSNSTSETFVVRDLRVGIPPPEVFATEALNITRADNGPGLADDTITFDTEITGRFGGTGWTTTGALPAAAAFGPVSLAVPAGHQSVTLRFADNLFPAYSGNLTVALPGPYFLGRIALPGRTGMVFTESATAPLPWVLDTTALTLNMTGGSEASVTSEVVNLSSVSGPVQFTANLHVTDRTGGFETDDSFDAQLILDGDFANPVVLTLPYDADLSGRMNGAELCPVPAVNPTLQDFDYPLSAIIPDNVSTVQLIIAGANNSTNETLLVSDILLSQAAADTDGDGMPDTWESANDLNPGSAADRDIDTDGDGQSSLAEYLAGTDPRSGTSAIRITDLTITDPLAGTGTVTWQSIPGKRYRLQISPDLATPFADTGTLVTASNSTTTAPVTLESGRGFARVRVVP